MENDIIKEKKARIKKLEREIARLKNDIKESESFDRWYEATKDKPIADWPSLPKGTTYLYFESNGILIADKDRLADCFRLLYE